MKRNTTVTLTAALSVVVCACSEHLPVAVQAEHQTSESGHSLTPPPLDLAMMNRFNSSGGDNSLRPRFTNSDKTSLMTNYISYFAGEIDTHTIHEYTLNTLIRSTRYGGPGADGIWLTADDTVFRYMDYAPVQAGVENATYDTAGVDGIWFNGDDRLRHYEYTQVDLVQNIIYKVTKSIIGADNIWFTADDEIGWIYSQIIVDATQTRWATYTGPGPDGDWFTIEDNVVYQHARNEYDASGLLTRHIVFTNTGVDGIPFTPDDTVQHYHDYAYDAQGRPLSSVSFSGGPGNDNIWFTPDDFVRSCKEQQRDVNDLPVRTVTWQPGPDLVCLNADDTVWGYHDDSFDAAGQLVESNAYYGTGADGIWFTPDDLIVSKRQYIPPN